MPQLGIGDHFVLPVVAIGAAACIFSSVLFVIVSATGGLVTVDLGLIKAIFV